MTTPTTSAAEALEREAIETIHFEILKLPATHSRGTATRLVQALVHAAALRATDALKTNDVSRRPKVRKYVADRLEIIQQQSDQSKQQPATTEEK